MSWASPEIPRSPCIQDYGFTLEQIGKMASLGFVFSGIATDFADGSSTSKPRFSFIPDSPMGRANRLAGADNLDLLATATEDARLLSYHEFMSKYPSLGPYSA